MSLVKQFLRESDKKDYFVDEWGTSIKEYYDATGDVFEAEFESEEEMLKWEKDREKEADFIVKTTSNIKAARAFFNYLAEKYGKDFTEFFDEFEDYDPSSEDCPTDRHLSSWWDEMKYNTTIYIDVEGEGDIYDTTSEKIYYFMGD